MKMVKVEPVWLLDYLQNKVKLGKMPTIGLTLVNSKTRSAGLQNPVERVF